MVRELAYVGDVSISELGSCSSALECQVTAPFFVLHAGDQLNPLDYNQMVEAATAVWCRAMKGGGQATI